MWIDFIATRAARTPQRLALIIRKVDSGERQLVTYADLDQVAKRWASWLYRNGVVPRDRVALLAPNRIEHLTIFFACIRLGAVFVPLNFRLGEAELKVQLALIEPSLFLTNQPHLCGDRPCQDIDGIFLGNETDFPAVSAQREDTLLMLFTSGSTGTPKGVMLHAGMLQQNMINTQLGWGLRPDDISVVHTPFFHTGGYNVTCLPLLRLGGCLIMTDRFEPEDMLHLLEEERVSVFFAVPTMFRMMRESAGFQTVDLSRLRLCISGGAPCPLSLITAWRARGVALKQGFGLTEVGPNCFAMTEEEAARRPDAIGKPMLHSQMKLINEQGQPVSDDTIGELCISGKHVCQGYWRAAELFAEVFKDGFFHTGDLMRRDPDGFYYVVGRKKEMYISGGENIFPGEVVRCLLRHPRINDAIVLPVADEKWGEVGFAFVRTDLALNLSQLRAFLDPLLSRYKHPHYLHALLELPLLANGKVDMNALRQLARLEVNRG